MQWRSKLRFILPVARRPHSVMRSITSFFKPQKRLNSSPNKGEKTKKIIQENKDNEVRQEDSDDKPHDSNSIKVEGMGSSWRMALENEFNREYYKKIVEFVAKERLTKQIFPPALQVHSWSTFFEASLTRVVILGQDPYHGKGQAHGLCFSVPPGVGIPPSLENIYKELKNDIPNFKHPRHGYLVGWATQGVLLLNSCLTVESGKANSHQGMGWELLTDAVIQWVNQNLNNVVFLLWGSYAQKKCANIDRKKHLVLQAVHPSPLSAHRGYFGCKHFSKANEYLEKSGKEPIDWNNLPLE